MNTIIGNLRADFPAAKIYLQKVHHNSSASVANVDAIRAGVDEIWAGSSGCLPGADLEGISTGVHYGQTGNTTTCTSELNEVALRTFNAISVANATAAGATLNSVGALEAGVATGQQNASANGATLDGASSIEAGAATGGSAGDATAPGALLNGASEIVAGSADGQQNASAPGATLAGSGSIDAGAAANSLLTSSPRFIIKAPARRFVVTGRG